MEVVNVYLIRRCMMRPSVSDRLVTGLNGFLQQVLDRDGGALRSSFTINVTMTASTPAAAQTLDVVVYLVQDAEHAVATTESPHPSGHGGRTYHGLAGGASAAEVYVRAESGALLARAALHEMFHYKTGWDNSLHAHASAGIVAASLRVDTPVTDGNLQLMGEHLGARRTPYLI